MGKKGRSVNYFTNLKAEFHFPKIGYSKSNFPKKMRRQCNLLKNQIKKKKKKNKTTNGRKLSEP